MKKITKFAIVVGLLLQVFGHPVETEEVGWDFCGPPGGHPFTFYGRKYGWPVPCIRVGEIWGCTTIPNKGVSYDGWGLILSLSAWAIALNLIEGFYPEVEY